MLGVLIRRRHRVEMGWFDSFDTFSHLFCDLFEHSQPHSNTTQPDHVWERVFPSDYKCSRENRAGQVEIETLLQLNLWNLGLVWFYRDFSQVPFQ